MASLICAVPILLLGASDFYHSISICCQEDYDDIVNGWNAKLKRSSAGEQRWGLFIATK
jgi:hypothetical protein